VASESYLFAIYRPSRLLKTLKTVDDIKRSSLEVLEKLYASQHVGGEIFERIKTQFREVFPEVEDIKIDQKRGREEEPIAVISIKERDVEKWIEHDNISSGMLRTLLHLSEILLLPDESILLIDEFENSLGVNCIDVVTEEVLQAAPRIQCVMTSHHPYVINNIGFDHWRVVTRRGSKVFSHRPEEIGIGKSSHEKFLQLINSKSFRGG
jgi:predicted ATPase